MTFNTAGTVITGKTVKIKPNYSDLPESQVFFFLVELFDDFLTARLFPEKNLHIYYFEVIS